MSMLAPDTTAVLNRTLAILRQSFPQYLRYARPYIPPNRAAAMEMIRDVAAGQDTLAERIGEQIVAAGAVPQPGDFPMEFTDTHDLGIDYLIRESIGYQRQDIAELETLAAPPDLPPTVHALVSETLGLARGHLDSLKELQSQPGSSTIVRNGGEPAYDND